MASMLLWPAAQAAKVTRSKRVLLVTLTRIVPRSESRSWNVRASRLTETTVPSYSRVAAVAAGTPADEGRGGDQGGGEELLHGLQH